VNLRLGLRFGRRVLERIGGFLSIVGLIRLRRNGVGEGLLLSFVIAANLSIFRIPKLSAKGSKPVIK